MKSLDIFPGLKTYYILAVSWATTIQAQWPEIQEGVGQIQAGFITLLHVFAAITKRMADVRNGNV